MSVTSGDKDLCTFTFTFTFTLSELRRGGEECTVHLYPVRTAIGKTIFAPKHGMRVHKETDVQL